MFNMESLMPLTCQHLVEGCKSISTSYLLIEVGLMGD